MNTITKISFSVLFILLFFFLATPTFAIPGQLNNKLITPPSSVTCECDETPLLKACNTLSSTCQLEKSAQENINNTLKTNLAQEKRTVLILEVVLGGLLLGAIGIFIFLRRN